MTHFLLRGPAGQSLLYFPLQHLTLQCLTLVLMRRTPRLAVPRTDAAVYQLFFLLLPGPGFHHTVHPQVHVEAALVAVHITHLLLTSTFYLLNILEHLLLAASIRHPLQHLHSRRCRVGREVRQPVIFLLDQHHADDTPGRTPRRQER